MPTVIKSKQSESARSSELPTAWTTALAAGRFLFFNDTATTEIYTLSLHDALPISLRLRSSRGRDGRRPLVRARRAGHRDAGAHRDADRKSTRLNSSHVALSRM